MRSTKKAEFLKKQFAGTLLRTACASLLLFPVATAQVPAPQVPTDHFGPPVCPGVTARAGTYRDRAEEARAEQALGANDPHALLSSEPLENFGIERDRLQDYADCASPNAGCYWADLDAQYHRAEEALAAQLSRPHKGEKLAMVMDIDETSLTGYCEMRREDFGYIGTMFNTWIIASS